MTEETNVRKTTEETGAVDNTIIEKKDNIVDDASQELVNATADTLRNFIANFKQTLFTRFGATCNINPEYNGEADKLGNGNYVFNITKKDITTKGHGQIRVVIEPDTRVSLELNPYSHYGEHKYVVIRLDSTGFDAETETLQGFLTNETIPENSIFQKEESYNPNEDYSALLAGYGIGPDGERKNPIPSPEK